MKRASFHGERPSARPFSRVRGGDSPFRSGSPAVVLPALVTARLPFGGLDGAAWDERLPHLVAWLITGLAAGWLAGFLLRGRGFGLGADLLIGMGGGMIGGGLVHLLRHDLVIAGWPAHFVVATAGGFVLVAGARSVQRLFRWMQEERA